MACSAAQALAADEQEDEEEAQREQEEQEDATEPPMTPTEVQTAAAEAVDQVQRTPPPQAVAQPTRRRIPAPAPRGPRPSVAMVEDDSPPEEASGGTEFRGQRQIAREVEAQNAAAQAAAAAVGRAGHRVSGRVRRAPAVHHAEFRAGY